MYKTEKAQQLTFDGFNQSCGMRLNPKDEWVVLADIIDWAAVEVEYSALFKSGRGRPAASARMALGALIIQKRANLSDRKLVAEVARNVSYQFFLGLQAFQPTSPFKHGVLQEFRKRLGKDFLVKVNEIFLKKANSTPAHAEDKPETPAANGNMGTIILDATCSPSNIRFPQNFSLLNEARVKLDAMIDKLHDPASGKCRPRTCRKVLRRKYLAHAKSRKRTAKQTRSIIRVMLCAVKRNMAFVDGFLEKGGFLEDRDMALLATIRKLYALPSDITFPCLLKPSNSSKWGKTGLDVYNTIEELQRNIKQGVGYLIQEYIEKEYEVDVVGLSLHHGAKTLIPALVRKIRDYLDSQSVFIRLDSISDYPTLPRIAIDRLVAKIGYEGIFSVEFLYSKGKYYFLEINMRNDGCGYVYTKAGVNYPYLWAQYASGSLDVEKMNKLLARTPLYMMQEPDIWGLFDRRVGLWEWLRDFASTRAFFTLSLRDPMPFLYTVYVHFRQAGKKLIRKVAG